MRLATWNVNGLRARLDFVKHWLEARRPDVVGLQELKLPDDQFPHEFFEPLGYRALTHGQKGWNGVVVLSRGEAKVAQCGLIGQEEFGARLLTVDLGELLFTSLYVPNGKSVAHEDFPRKLDWLDALDDYLKYGCDPARPHVLGGDFNLCPGPLDSWNEAALHGTIFHTEAERSRFQALLATGLVDVFRERQPELQAFSWWDYRGGAFHRREGLRIDLLLASRALAPRFETVEIDRDYRKKKDGLTPSDHAPVWADLR